MEPVEPEAVEELDPPPVDPELLETTLVPAEPPVPELAAARLASAGSWPETSWMKITPHASANVPPTAASTRLRVRTIRSRRARSLSATRRRVSGEVLTPVSLDAEGERSV